MHLPRVFRRMLVPRQNQSYDTLRAMIMVNIPICFVTIWSSMPSIDREGEVVLSIMLNVFCANRKICTMKRRMKQWNLMFLRIHHLPFAEVLPSPSDGLFPQAALFLSLESSFFFSFDSRLLIRLDCRFFFGLQTGVMLLMNIRFLLPHPPYDFHDEMEWGWKGW